MERPVLVTGAGSGIGLASAIEAARLGFPAVAAVHRHDQVGAVRSAAAGAGVDLAVEVFDVTDEAAASRVVDRVQPWALVNNAGYLNAGLVEDVTLDEARRQYDVMLFAPARLVQLALPIMRRQGGGRIVNVSSAVGETNVPFQGWYDASKRALSALSDVLRAELAADGIDVVVIEPGVVATPLWDKAHDELVTRRERAREPARYDRAMDLMQRIAENGSDPREIAAVVGEVLHAAHPRYRYRVGAGAHALQVVGRLVPTSVRDRVTSALVGR